MEIWIPALFFLCAPAAAFLIIKELRRVHRERLLMTKLRNSNFYAELYPLVRYARRRDLDRVRIERGRIVFYSIYPPGKLCEYSLNGTGFRILSDSRTRVLAEVLGEDIPELKSHRYALSRYKIVRPNGHKDYGFAYTLRPMYKAQMAQAASARYHISPSD